MRQASGPIEYLFRQHVRMPGAKGVQPPVVRQRLAEPRRGLANRHALRCEDPLQLLPRHPVISFVSLHLNLDCYSSDPSRSSNCRQRKRSPAFRFRSQTIV